VPGGAWTCRIVWIHDKTVGDVTTSDDEVSECRVVCEGIKTCPCRVQAPCGGCCDQLQCGGCGQTGSPAPPPGSGHSQVTSRFPGHPHGQHSTNGPIAAAFAAVSGGARDLALECIQAGGRENCLR
jgi:hypothetical protein